MRFSRGKPPEMSDELLDIQPEDVIKGRAVSPEMLRDLQIIAHLNDVTLSRISQHLSTLQGLEAKESLTDGLKPILSGLSPRSADAVVRTLINLEQDDIKRTVASVERWRKSTPERGQFFTDQMQLSLERNLSLLIAEYPCVALLRKADRLLRDVGNEFQDVAIFCDMRPVFNDTRSKIEGFVSLANLRLFYISQTGQRHAFEVALSEDELKSLIEESEKALAKLDVLKATSDKLIHKVNA